LAMIPLFWLTARHRPASLFAGSEARAAFVAALEVLHGLLSEPPEGSSLGVARLWLDLNLGQAGQASACPSS
jgi:hypothetical protein